MKKVLFVCLIAASFTACNSGTSTETTKDSTSTVTKDTVAVIAPVVTDSTKKDSVIVKKDSVVVKKDSTKKK